VEIRAQSHGDAEVLPQDGTAVAVSRTFRERLQQAIGRRP